MRDARDVEFQPDPRKIALVGVGVILLVVVVLALFARQGIRREADRALANLGATVLGVLYAWFLPSFLLKIRHLTASTVASSKTAG